MNVTEQHHVLIFWVAITIPIPYMNTTVERVNVHVDHFLTEAGIPFLISI